MRRLVFVTALLIAACSNTPAPAAKPATMTPAASPSAAPATITREAAAQQYLRLAEAPNKVRDAMNAKCDADWRYLNEGGTTNKTTSEILANVKACDAANAKAIRAWVATVRAATWPAEVNADLDASIKLSEAQAYMLERMAKARGEREYRDLGATLPQDDGSADLVRARLGLPVRSPS